MKMIPFLENGARRSVPRQRGVALTIVLAIIALITAMVVCFLQRANSERSTAGSYSATVNTRQLADTAVNLVQGQINEATSKGSAYAWASQPGAIRLYDDQGLATIYRLYSAGALTTGSVGDLSADIPAVSDNAWQSKASPVWVDLNAPATTGTGGLAYPILDPRDPSDSSKTLAMDGFSVGGTGSPAVTDTQRAPMPVRWLYILENGRIVAPDPSLDNATTVTVSSASGTNPIVGRIAFWTDDETCKVNINTAGGDGKVSGTSGYSDIANKTFWDMPRFCSSDETGLAVYQPFKQEYQRYPGHPATVSLNKILSGLGLNLSSADFYSLTPRYANGGSKGATVPFSDSNASVSVPNSRLYSSVSELLFNPDRNASAAGAPDNARQRMESARFFLTAQSRAPEVNLFGQPRLSIWPISAYDDDQHRTAIDRLLAFSATVKSKGGDLAYYFTRQSALSSSADVSIARNAGLLGYLDRLTNTSIPGFGGAFDAKYGQKGRRQILTEIFDYVRVTNLKDPLLPGLTGDYTSRTNPNWYAAACGDISGWGFGINQVTPTSHGTWGTQGFGNFPRVSEVVLQFVGLGQGKITTTSPQQAAIAVPATQFGNAQISHNPAITADANGNGQPQDNTRAVQAFFLLNFTNPVQMLTRGNPFFWTEVEGLDKLKLVSSGSSIDLGFPQKTAMIVSGNLDGDGFGTNAHSGYMGFVGMVGAGGAKKSLNKSGKNFNYNTLYSMIIPVPVSSDGKMTLIGGDIIIRTYAPKYNDNTAYGDLVQSVKVTIPSPSVSSTMTLVSSTTPLLSSTINMPTVSAYNNIGTKYEGNGTDNPDRWIYPRSSGTNKLIDSNNDVVQSFVLNSSGGWGDARMLACSGTVANAFVPHPLWGSAALAHNCFYGMLRPHPGNTDAANWGRLVAGATYPNLGYPVVPATTGTSGVAFPADWDSGIANARVDGPWINKTDEGGVPLDTNGNVDSSQTPYFAGGVSKYIGIASFFTPNRQVPSPGVLGSLPTGVDPDGVAPKPWQTLLFCPHPGHPGLGIPAGGPPYTKPPDHLMLDLFWMPVAEPYAISEPFSSAGKVNLNYQIVPFTYITRSTAVRAVLGTEKIAMVGKADAVNYRDANNFTKLNKTTRYPLNMEATLSQFEDKFSSADLSKSDLFRSASQICDLYLVPGNYASVSDFANAWYGDSFAMVGDNLRERPYTDIYGRITTKSNTFTVYYTVQALKNTSKDPAQWNEGKGVVQGEYRGSTTLERFIDPNVAVPDYATDTGAASLEFYYRWRIVANHQFAP